MKSKCVKRIAAILLAGCSVISLTGCGIFETLSGNASGRPTSFSTVDELESGKAYVWKDANESDVNKASGSNTFQTCITGDINFTGKELEEVTENPRSIWVSDEADEKIPTVTSKDKLLYVSDTEVPDSIVFERFADYGYTIGVSNFIADGGDHYYIPFAQSGEDDYKYYIDLKSDAGALSKLQSITKLYLDKVGDTKLSKKTVSDGGTVLGLQKGKSYACEFYTGTYYQDFKLKANIHSFGSLERFVSYDFDFLHSNCIAITIPEYFKTGYYFVNGVGLFRYVADADLEKYNGKAYDENIDWNDPIIIYDENGSMISDPSDPDFEEKQEETEMEPEGDSDVTEVKEGEASE